MIGARLETQGRQATSEYQGIAEGRGREATRAKKEVGEGCCRRHTANN